RACRRAAAARPAWLRDDPRLARAWPRQRPDDRAVRSCAARRRLLGREVDLHSRAVRIEEEYLPDARTALTSARALDPAPFELGEKPRQIPPGERHVIDHAGGQLALRPSADHVPR